MQPRQQKQWKSWLLLAAPRYDWSQNLKMKGKKAAGFLKAKEQAIKCNGCNLNRACSFLMAPGCGQDIVLVDLMSGLSCGAEKCCELSLYLSLPGNSAAYVALTSLHCTREIQPSTWNEKKAHIFTHHLFMFTSLATDHYGCLHQGCFWMQDRWSKQNVINRHHNKDVILETVKAEPSTQLSVLHTLFDNPSETQPGV